MVTTINLGIHKTGTVSYSRLFDASEALNDVDSHHELGDVEFNPVHELTDLDNSSYGSGDNQEREDSIRNAEDKLYAEGELRNYDCHVIIYERSISGFGLDGAGFANWVVGANWWDDVDHNHFVQSREYEEFAGKYALCFVNAATGNSPYSDFIFKQTVVHEVGHNLDGQHHEGAIEESPVSNDDVATPLATWYVESNCGVEWPNQSVNNLCKDSSGSKEACLHIRSYANCAAKKMNSTVNEYM